MHQAIQIGGSLLVLVPFVLVQAGRLTTEATVYLALNLAGSAALAMDAALGQQWGVPAAGGRVGRGLCHGRSGACSAAAVSGEACRAGMAAPADPRTVPTSCARSAAGMPPASRPEPVDVPSVASGGVPGTATPSSEPSWRNVLCSPEACPDSSTGISARITLVSWAVAVPTPAPSSNSHAAMSDPLMLADTLSAGPASANRLQRHDSRRPGSRGPGQEARDDEHGHADDEQAPAPVEVAGAADRQQQGGDLAVPDPGLNAQLVMGLVQTASRAVLREQPLDEVLPRTLGMVHRGLGTTG